LQQTLNKEETAVDANKHEIRFKVCITELNDLSSDDLKIFLGKIYPFRNLRLVGDGLKLPEAIANSATEISAATKK